MDCMMQKDMKRSLSSLWKVCVAFRMFNLNREEGVLSQCQHMMENLSGSGYPSPSNIQTSTSSKQYRDNESERIQRLVVMETALAAGLGSILSEYVLAQADTSNRFTTGRNEYPAYPLES